MDNISVMITDKCNLQCKHCIESCDSLKNSELSYQELEHFFCSDFFKEIKQIKITGGEPLIHNDILKIIDLCDGDNEFSLITNGLLINKQLIDRFSLMENIEMNISIESGDNVINDYIRGVNSLDEVSSKIELIRSSPLFNKLSLVVTINKLNYKELFSTIDFARKKGINRVKFGLIEDIGRASNNKDELIMSLSELLDLFENYFEMYLNYAKEKNITLELPNISYVCPLFSNKMFCYINSSGDVYPCRLAEYYNKLYLGNIKKDFYSEIMKTFDRIIAETVEAFKSNVEDECLKCHLWKKCFGGCIVRSVDDNRNICELKKFMFTMQMKNILVRRKNSGGI